MVDSIQEELRIGIIGGGWPGLRHAEAFAATGAGQVTAVADVDAGCRAALAAVSPGARAFTSAEELLAGADVDAVVIALPTYLHRPIAVAALASGRHVLCEKPPALHAGEVADMIEAARRHRRILAFGLQRRALRTATAARALIEAGELGAIYHARASWTRAWGAPTGASGWHGDPARSGGGPLIDIGVHVLDLTWWLMGRPEVRSVAGVTHNRTFDRGKVEDAAFALVRLGDGAAIQLETSWIAHRDGDEFRVELAGTRAGLVLERSSLALVRADAAGRQIVKPNIPPGAHDDDVLPFVEQASNFASAIRSGVAPLTPADDALTIMRIIDGIYRSAREGREITIDSTDHPRER